MGGSNWSSARVYATTSGQKFFVKSSRARDEGMFKGEALGLQAMFDTGALYIPKVYGYGLLPSNGGTFIAMEYLNFSGRLDSADFGERMALMHLAKPTDTNAAAGKFGFSVDNTIGGTPQPNQWTDNWIDFFREKRLRHQLNVAGDITLQRLGDRLLHSLEVFFEGVEINPSVLHGDLWSGNIGAVNGIPSIYDPATYYGHHEAEWGMSWCASFGPSFWEGYHRLIPRAPGFEDRAQLYQLYHYLNHYNLFGGSYYSSAQRIMENLVRKL